MPATECSGTAILAEHHRDLINRASRLVLYVMSQLQEKQVGAWRAFGDILEQLEELKEHPVQIDDTPAQRAVQVLLNGSDAESVHSVSSSRLTQLPYLPAVPAAVISGPLLCASAASVRSCTVADPLPAVEDLADTKGVFHAKGGVKWMAVYALVTLDGYLHLLKIDKERPVSLPLKTYHLPSCEVLQVSTTAGPMLNGVEIRAKQGGLNTSSSTSSSYMRLLRSKPQTEGIVIYNFTAAAAYAWLTTLTSFVKLGPAAAATSTSSSSGGGDGRSLSPITGDGVNNNSSSSSIGSIIASDKVELDAMAKMLALQLMATVKSSSALAPGQGSNDAALKEGEVGLSMAGLFEGSIPDAAIAGAVSAGAGHSGGIRREGGEVDSESEDGKDASSDDSGEHSHSDESGSDSGQSDGERAVEKPASTSPHRPNLAIITETEGGANADGSADVDGQASDSLIDIDINTMSSGNDDSHPTALDTATAAATTAPTSHTKKSPATRSRSRSKTSLLSPSTDAGDKGGDGVSAAAGADTDASATGEGKASRRFSVRRGSAVMKYEQGLMEMFARDHDKVAATRGMTLQQFGIIVDSGTGKTTTTDKVVRRLSDHWRAAELQQNLQVPSYGAASTGGAGVKIPTPNPSPSSASASISPFANNNTHN